MVTMKDIANELGVSVMTVSRVVNGQHAKVSKENISRVQALIKKYNYVPNSTARSLSSKSSRIISLVVRGSGNVLSNPYNAEMTGYIAALVQEENFYLMIHVVEKYDDLTQKLRAWNSEGAIFLGAFDDDIEQILFDNRIPLIFTDCYTSLRQVSNIGIDDYKGGELAAYYFLEQGHKRLAFLGGSFRSNVILNRLEGFKAALDRAAPGIPAPLVLEYDRPMKEIVNHIMNSKDPVSGVFITADVMGREFIYEATTAGFSVPDDISIIGFDDLPLSQFTVPPLTTIRQDLSRKAVLATETLFRHMKDLTHPTASVILDVSLVERDTVKAIV